MSVISKRVRQEKVKQLLLSFHAGNMHWMVRFDFIPRCMCINIRGNLMYVYFSHILLKAKKRKPNEFSTVTTDKLA